MAIGLSALARPSVPSRPWVGSASDDLAAPVFGRAHGAYVRGTYPADQLRDVLDRFAPPLAPRIRCAACNGLLAPVRKLDVRKAERHRGNRDRREPRR